MPRTKFRRYACVVNVSRLRTARFNAIVIHSNDISGTLRRGCPISNDVLDFICTCSNFCREPSLDFGSSTGYDRLFSENTERLKVGEKFQIVITRNINGDLVRTTIETSRRLPACFSAFSDRCERGPRLLLIVSSNRELEIDERSISLLYIAAFKHGRLVFSERALFCTWCRYCTY